MSKLTNLEKIRKLPWQYSGNALNIVFWLTAAYGSIFILFLNELGFDQARIGFLASLLPFCGLLALAVAPFASYFGLKRTFILFFSLRKTAAAALLLTPLILAKFGQNTAFYWVTGAVLAFAVFRATADTAIFPWAQEMIPNSIRGKFWAINNLNCMLVSIATVGVAGYAIRHWPGLHTFIIIIGGGIIAGLFSAWCFMSVPGGKPVKSAKGSFAHYAGMLESLKDPNFRRFMTGLAIVCMPTLALQIFFPLYMKQEIGLPTGLVIWLDIGNFAGSLLLGYFAGMASDRFGSKPVMLFGICVWLVFPALCFLMPRDGEIIPYAGVVATFLMGGANITWVIGYCRYLFISAVPENKKTAYMAVFYAGVGLSSGLGALLGGWLIKACGDLNAQMFFFTIDKYTPLFALSALMLIGGALMMSKVRSDGAMPVRRFVGMFLQGNPVTAAGTIFRYYRAADEEERISITERMGYANNPISSNELIEALNDPSFNVRYEAIIAIAHTRPTPALIDALLLVLGGNEPDLSIHAAWALGRLGDKTALIALRETLESELPLLRARSARALATLNDVDSIPRLLHYFRTETNPGLRIAYAQALGKMRSSVAITEMLEYLASLEDESLQAEMALALGRIVGGEKDYISLWRQFKSDLNTNAAQALLAMKKGIAALPENGNDLAAIARRCSRAFEDGNTEQGAAALTELLIKTLPTDRINEPFATILADCAQRLKEFGAARSEYLLLSIHTLERVIKSPHNGTVESERQLPPHPPLIADGR
ncbi:MAG: MFS transporter [Sedimentisphaerales bacterium]|nr:MFS transporter [Sedimentisphaerales bacterium]